MCGIAGILQFNQVVSPDKLHNMGEAILHRGPDDRGIWFKEGIGMAHQRLSIIDTSANGHQPMHDPTQRYTIIFNGEIYNHDSFRDELKAKGFTFHSTSDTEVLLYLFMLYGPQMLHRLNGMFAFAIWDDHKKELFIGRDRFGVKPLYYHKNNEGFYFASEPKAIFAAGVEKAVDSQQVNEWLLYRFVAGEPTLLKGIKKLLPGHYAVVKMNGEVQTTRWYHLGERIQNHPEISNPQQWFEDTFHNSVKYRMVADVPVGVLLSGGLDSSSVAASLHHNGFRHIQTFNIGFRDYVHDESGIARMFSEQINFPFHSIYLEGHDLFQTLNKSIYQLDEPLAHMNDPQILAVSEYAKNYVKVLLSGEGADELIGGYVRYKTFRYMGLRHQINMMLRLTPDKYKSPRIKKLERYLKVGSINQLIVTNSANYFESDFDELGLSYLGITNAYRAEILKEAKRIYPNSAMRQLLYYDQHTYLQSLNDRNDRATMGASIECREPFQDYRLAEGLGTLDLKWLTSGKKGKRILKETMQKYLPEYITKFRKIGLSVPWIQLIKQSPELNDLWNNFSANPSLENDTLDKVDLKSILKDINNEVVSKYEPLALQYFMFYIWKNNYINSH